MYNLQGISWVLQIYEILKNHQGSISWCIYATCLLVDFNYIYQNLGLIGKESILVIISQIVFLMYAFSSSNLYFFTTYVWDIKLLVIICQTLVVFNVMSLFLKENVQLVKQNYGSASGMLRKCYRWSQKYLQKQNVSLGAALPFSRFSFTSIKWRRFWCQTYDTLSWTIFYWKNYVY